MIVSAQSRTASGMRTLAAVRLSSVPRASTAAWRSGWYGTSGSGRALRVVRVRRVDVAADAEHVVAEPGEELELVVFLDRVGKEKEDVHR
jgi:hypothetical protein